MPKILNELADKLKGLELKGFTGNVTLHYQNGVPRKIRVEEVQDLDHSPGALPVAGGRRH